MVAAMIAFAIAVALSQNEALTLPPFTAFDGKSWGGMAIGTTEKDLKKQVKTGKTVGPDPASVRINVSQKDWVVAGILTDVKQRGALSGFTVELEKGQPLESLEALEKEIGPSDFSAFPKIRYSDWSLVVWKEKGIAAVISGGNRPIVQKVLLTTPATLAQNLDLWEREQTMVRNYPRLPVSGFDFSVTSEPRDSGLESACLSAMRRAARRLMETYDASGWMPSRNGGSQIQVALRIKKKTEFALDGSLSFSSHDELGDISVSESTSDTAKRDIEVPERARNLFETMMDRVPKDINDKLRRPVWQLEGRQFTALARPKL
jgi:hypothetical protein